MTATFCKTCSGRKECKAICQPLECYLAGFEFTEQSDLTLSPDYIARCFGRPDGEPDVSEIRYANKVLLEVFESFGYSSLKFFLIWKYYVEDGFSQAKIAEFLDVSQALVSRAIALIKAKKYI